MTNVVSENFIIYHDKKYYYDLIDNDLFDQYDMDCRECCFDSTRDSDNNHICPSKDKTFLWSCSKHLKGFQILLKEVDNE